MSQRAESVRAESQHAGRRQRDRSRSALNEVSQIIGLHELPAPPVDLPPGHCTQGVENSGVWNTPTPMISVPQPRPPPTGRNVILTRSGQSPPVTLSFRQLL